MTSACRTGVDWPSAHFEWDPAVDAVCLRCFLKSALVGAREVPGIEETAGYGDVRDRHVGLCQETAGTIQAQIDIVACRGFVGVAAKDPFELNDVVADPAYQSALNDCDNALRKLLDPEKIDAMAKDDQAERLEADGGIDAVIARGSPGYTPAPGEKPEYM